MNCSFDTRLKRGLFPEMPQSFADGLLRAAETAGGTQNRSAQTDAAKSSATGSEPKKRRFPVGKVLAGALAAVLVAACVVIAVFAPGIGRNKHGAVDPAAYNPLRGRWTLTEVEQNGETVDPETIGLQMQLQFSDESVTVSTQTGGAEGQNVYRYAFADNAIELTAEGGEIPVLPASGTYDPETDTLRFANEDGARAIFRRKAAASLQASMLGVWSHSYTKYEGIGLTIKKNGAFLTDYTCVSETDTPLIYTVENNVITFTGDGISFTAVYLADEDALSVTWNDKTLQFERSPSLESPWGTWTMTEMILKDGTRFSADEIGSESTLYFAYLGPLTYTWNVNGNVSQTEYEFWIKGNSIPLRLADGTDVNDPEITYDLETDTLRLFTANDGRTYVYVRMPDLAGKWTLTGIEYNGSVGSPELFGMQMWLEINANGTAVMTMSMGDDMDVARFLYEISGAEIVLNEVKDTDPMTIRLTYDAETDTLHMDYSQYGYEGNSSLIFSRTPDAEIPEVQTTDGEIAATAKRNAAGIWKSGEGDTLWITDDGMARSEALSGLTGNLTYTVEDGTLHFSLTGTDFTFTARYDESKDTLSVTANGNTKLYSRVTGSIAGKWTMTGIDLLAADFSAEKTGWKMYLEIFDDGSMIAVKITDDAAERTAYRLLHVDENTFTFEEDTGAVVTSSLPPWKIVYDAATDTLRMEYDFGINPTPVFSRTPDAVIPETERKEITELRAQFPEYFGLDTSKGLKVYVWQMAENDFSCALISGTDERSELEIGIQCKGTTIEQMRLILSTYGLEEKEIEVVPFHNPVSSYWYEIDNDYKVWIRRLVKENMPFTNEELEGLKSPPFSIADVVYDVDGDGQLETCSLNRGPTSSDITVVFTVYRNGTLAYRNTFDMDEGELTFYRSDNGLLIQHVIPWNDGIQLHTEYSISIENGMIVLTDEIRGGTVEYWGLADPQWNMN